MSEHEIIKQIERIYEICSAVMVGLAASRKEGRMPSLVEASELDRLSQELTQCIGMLPPNVCSKMQNVERQEWARSSLARARDALGSVVQYVSPSGASAPRASSGRLGSYNSY